MEFLNFEETQRAFSLANTILDRVGDGSDIVVSRSDAELVVLGLFVIVRLSAYAAHFPMIEAPRD